MRHVGWTRLVPWLWCALAAACSEGAPGEDDPDMSAAVAGARPARDAGGMGGASAERDGGDASVMPKPATDAGPAQMPAQPPNIADCGEWPPFNVTYPPLIACVGFESAELPPGVGEISTTPAGTRVSQLEFRGQVIETGTRAPRTAGYCFQYETSEDGLIVLDSALVRSFWLLVENEDGVRALVGVLAPQFAWRLLVGESIVVTQRSESGGFGVTGRSKIEVRKQSGELVAWFAIDATVEQFESPAEVRLALGEQQCRGSASCFPSWARHNLAVQLEGEAAPSTLPYGRIAPFGAYVVAHGGVDVALEPSRCGEAQLDRAAAGIWLMPF